MLLVRRRSYQRGLLIEGCNITWRMEETGLEQIMDLFCDSPPAFILSGIHLTPLPLDSSTVSPTCVLLFPAHFCFVHWFSKRKGCLSSQYWPYSAFLGPTSSNYGASNLPRPRLLQPFVYDDGSCILGPTPLESRRPCQGSSNSVKFLFAGRKAVFERCACSGYSYVWVTDFHGFGMVDCNPKLPLASNEVFGK